MSAVASQPTSAFLPNNIPGCQLWFDAADESTFTKSGTAISVWRDKSSNAYQVNQATASNQPTYTINAQNGLSGIQLTTTTFLSNVGSAMPNFTTGANTSVFMAVRNASTNDGWNIFNTIWFLGTGGGGTQRYHFSFNSNTVDGTTLFAGGIFSGQVTSNAVAPLSNAILGFTVSATSASIHVNGSSNGYGGQTLPDANNTTHFIFGENRFSTVVGSNVMIFEMVGFNTQVTQSQRQQVEGYLSWKWGLQGSLPATHPYKQNPPFQNTLSLPVTITSPISNSNAPLFAPTQISGCYLWLDAGDPRQFTLTTGTSNITQWRDKSQNGFHAIASGNPVYNSALNRVQLNGSTSYLSNISYALNLSQRSIFLVMSENTRTNVAGLFPQIPNPRTGDDYLTTNGLSIETSSGLRFYGNSGGYISDIGNTTLLAQGIYNDNMNGTQGSSFFNGTNTSNNVATYTAGTCAGYVIGTRWLGGITAQYYVNGNINEIIVYNTPVSTTQRQQIEGYLAWKWGLQANLPASHPYKTTPFYPFAFFPTSIALTNTQFIPLNVSTCQLWLDAADRSTFTFSGANISQWRDKSGNAYNANAVGTIPYNASINGKTTPSWTGSVSTYFRGTGLTNTGTTLTAFSVFIMNSSSYSVARILSLAAVGQNDFNSALYTAAIERSSSSFNAFRNNAALSAVTAIFASPVLVCSQFNGANHTFYLNGTGGTPVNSTGNFGYTAYNVGSSFGEENLVPLNGTIGEVILYTGSLSTYNRQRVEGYLAWKWGLQGNLPSTHPYALVPPLPF